MLFVIALFVINLLGDVLIIGFFVAAPVTFLAHAFLYRRLVTPAQTGAAASSRPSGDATLPGTGD